MKPKYKRILLKVSGEALSGSKGTGLDSETLSNIAKVVKKCVDTGVEVAIVVGGGNFWRGRSSEDMNRTRADHIGMLATVMNSLALQSALEAEGVITRVQTAIEMRQIAETYIRDKAMSHLRAGKVVIFGCGTGNPFFSTDTTAALRAAEIEAEAILLAKSIDAVYDSDPATNPDAKRFSKLSYKEVLNRGLKVMDSTATSLCMDNNIPILVFGMEEPENIYKVLCGENMGTVVSNDDEIKF
ncbi:MAG: UMP kinase [Clostridia bacterium]|nr:UMP kinase [Clostridia bacterium]